MAEVITREKHPGRVAQGHKLAALMKKKKEEILRNKEQCTVQSTEQSTVQSTEQSTEQPSLQSTEQSKYSRMALIYMELVWLLSWP